ncbi:LytR/AlgR family response regulator transcription factor [Anaerocolumna xylanovorans]|uniref:Stage 0 sporulation protein A homolog n=1 Tax=Anaerocolumna xylanovorans DSM 12503 TaxID=1121345 RepID=A0A1M7YCI8_9FIRM|nr:LytTR family DNA-binding domain-containing protein [Anaerocolumna xylanovorans]SHO50311.1 two component transcriptional regulator, LytTR family [Anaerocolumna xylanovorans DSM 12503]
MIRIALCDDELDELHLLESVIKQYEGERNLSFRISSFRNGEELTKDWENFDIVFLDIKMGGMDGMEAAKNIRKKDKQVEIIFTTSHIGLTKEALSVHAFEYLEKPVNKDTIYLQLDEVLEKISQNKQVYAKRKETVEINTGKTTIRFAVDDIYYFERSDRKIKAVTKRGNYIVMETISSLEQKLKDYDFVMPHQSFVVNINHMQDYYKDEILMTNNDKVPVAQKRSSEFKRVMRDFLQKQMEKNL